MRQIVVSFAASSELVVTASARMSVYSIEGIPMVVLPRCGNHGDVGLSPVLAKTIQREELSTHIMSLLATQQCRS